MRAQGPLQAPTPTVGGHRRRATSGTLASWALTPVSTGPAHLHGAPPKAAKSPQTAAWCQRSAEGQQEQKMAGRPLCPRRPRPQPANRPFTASVSSSVTGPGHPQLQPWASTPPRAKVHNPILAPSGACRGDGQGPSVRAVFFCLVPMSSPGHCSVTQGLEGPRQLLSLAVGAPLRPGLPASRGDEPGHSRLHASGSKPPTEHRGAVTTAGLGGDGIPGGESLPHSHWRPGAPV